MKDNTLNKTSQVENGQIDRQIDRQTDRQTDRKTYISVYRVASLLKNKKSSVPTKLIHVDNPTCLKPSF